MITFYCGKVVNDAVVSYHAVNIVAHNELVSTYTDVDIVDKWTVTLGEDSTEFPISKRFYIGDDLPATTPAINWVSAVFAALGEDPTNYDPDDLIGQEVYFFKSQSYASMLPFHMEIRDYYSHDGIIFRIIDNNLRGIRMWGTLPYNITSGLTNLSGCYAVMAPGWTASSFDELLAGLATRESAANSNNGFLSAIGYNVDEAPFLFYNVAYKAWEETGKKYSIQSHVDVGFGYLGNFINLRSFPNWYSLLVGDMTYKMPVLYLASEHKGRRYIELSVPAYLTRTGYVPDAGIHKANTSGTPANSQVYGYGNVIVGTDLCELLDVGETITLRNGTTISRTASEFNITSNGITYSSGNAHSARSGTISTYIMVSPSLVNSNPNNWKETLTATTTALEYNPDRVMFSLVTYSYDQHGQLGNSWFSGLGTLIASGQCDRIDPYAGGYVFNSYNPAAELAGSKFQWNWSVGMYNELTDEAGNPYATGNTGNNGSSSNTGGGYTPSGGNGGGGSYSADSDNIHGITSNITGAAGLTNLFKIYTVTAAAINAIGEWANSLFSDMFGVIESIISLKQVVVPDNMTISGTTQALEVAGHQIASHGVDYNGTLVDKQFCYANLGSITLSEYYGSFLDYEGYTTVEIYLPFAGTFKLDTNLVMNSRLSIQCGVDVVSGTVVYDITVENDKINSVVYTFTGNCANDLPVTYTDYSGKISGFVNTAIGIVGVAAAPATGGLSLGATAGAITGAMGAAKAPDHGSKGSAGKNAGYAMPRVPYLIITRPIRSMPENYGRLVGFPAQIGGNVSSFSGFTKLSDIELDNILGASDSELREIETILKEGVYV